MHFQRLIKDLIKWGWSQSAIAIEVGCSQPNIARLLKEAKTEPRYSVGAAIVDLHADIKADQ